MADDIFSGLRSQVSKLVPLTDEEWSLFRTNWEPKELEKGEVATQIGDVENYFYYVHEGVIRGYAIKEGEDVSIGFSYKGDYSGAYDSLLSRTPSEWCMQAVTKTSTLRIYFERLHELFDQHKNFERWGRLFNAQMLMLMSKRQVESRSFSAEERYDRLMNQSPHLFQLVPQKHIASYLGMTAETLSRLRKRHD